MRKLSELKPYDKNAKKHGKNVDWIANSIKEFGFNQPIVIDEQGVIICGHGRYFASKKLGLKQVPTYTPEDLSEEQVKAYRLADNKVAEADWDFGLLKDEMIDLDFDMSDFGFDLSELLGEDDDYIPRDDNERVRTGNSLNLDEYDVNFTEGEFNMPVLRPCNKIPSDLIGFNYVLSTKERKCGVHFYIDDYQFERIWNSPYEYIDKLKQFECVFTPDFSLYLGMPIALDIYNTYRSRLVGQILQNEGINVIPSVSWAEPSTYKFCFDGLPKKSTVAVATTGIKHSEQSYKVWCDGMDEMIQRLEPKTILVYGDALEYDFPSNIKVVYYKNKVTERMKANAKK